MEKLIKKWLNKGVQPTGWEKNTYTPKIVKTVYPNWEKGNNGKPILSPNGTGEFYGLIEKK